MSENKKKTVNEKAPKKDKSLNQAKGDSAVATAEKKTVAPITIALIITAVLLVGVLIAVAVVLITDYVKQDKGFDYMTSNLDKYVEFKEDYKNFELNVDVAEPHDIDVDVAILNLITADKNKDALDAGALKTTGILGAGDVVTIWYRGYLIGENGEEIVVANMSNFASEKASNLELGSGNFVSGFELGLVGIEIGDYPKFEKIKIGEVKEGQVAYISFTKAIGEGENVKKTTQTSVRVDLSTDVDKEFGTGFKDRIIGAAIAGDKLNFNTVIDGQVCYYYDVKVDFVTECETNPIVVDVYFPYDYSQTNLRNESAKFEVYVEGFVDYDAPEFNDEYISGKIEKGELSVTLEELNKYEGETLTEKYYAYAEETIWKLYEQERKNLTEEAIWNHYQSIVNIKKYPTYKVEEIYEGYVNDVFEQYLSSEGQIYNSYTGSYSTYTTLDTYAPVYLGLSSSSGQTQTWREYLYSTAEALIKERLIVFYLMRTEGFTPSEEDFEKLLAATREEYVNEYINQYLSYEGKTKDDYTEEEFTKFRKDRENEIYSYYDDSYFEEVTYYNIVVKNIIDWPTVITLDERRAYPVNQ